MTVQNLTNTLAIDGVFLQAINAAQTDKTYQSIEQFFADTQATTRLGYLFTRLFLDPTGQEQPASLTLGVLGGTQIVTLDQYKTWRQTLADFDFSQFTYTNLTIQFQLYTYLGSLPTPA